MCIVYVVIFFCSFSYRGKVIIQSVSNIVGIAYSITVIKDITVGTLDAAVLREIRDLIPFYVFLILFQFLSKYLS